MAEFKYGDVYYVNFLGKNNQIQGRHPAVIVSNNVGNAHSSNLQCIPISSKQKRYMPTHVFLDSQDSGLFKPSWAQCESQQIIDKTDVEEFVCQLPAKYRHEIAKACSISSPFLIELNYEEVISLLTDLKCRFSAN